MTACVTIRVLAPPDAVDDTYTTCPTYTACIVGAAAGLTSNDNSSNPGPIVVTGYTNASTGSVQVSPNGSFVWTPPFS